LAMVLRDAVSNHPLLNRYFQILTTSDLIPTDYRESGIETPIKRGLQRMREAWGHDEFVLDPSRVTLHIGLTGVDGDTFKHAYLMDRYGIQVNKTSRNTVLFMTNIGTTRSSVAYLIEVLVMLAREFEDEIERMGRIDRRARELRVASLTSQPPPLPDFSAFHRCFRGDPGGATPEGDLRRAFFLAYDDRLCEYVTAQQAWERVNDGREVVSATFVIPYPPGFPILVPGQIISRDILAFMQALDTREIHGYLSDIGYRVFTEEALTSGSEASAAPSA
jgi:arginine decarboxylase